MPGRETWSSAFGPVRKTVKEYAEQWSSCARCGTTGDQAVAAGLCYCRLRLRYCVGIAHTNTGGTAFALDPEIKREAIWAGSCYRPASALVSRDNAVIKVRSERKWQVTDQHTNSFGSMFSQMAGPDSAPEILYIKEIIRGWRFYDHFRTDSEAPARHPQLGTRTPVLHHDGGDLAAALQTIRQVGDIDALKAAVDDAFPGAQVHIVVEAGGQFSVQFQQNGLLRPLTAAELSDGTLRYLLWVAAPLTPRPPSLMVLNEPETSLHPDLLPALVRLIIRASEQSQIWVVSHANRLIIALNKSSQCHAIELEKELGQRK